MLGSVLTTAHPGRIEQYDGFEGSEAAFLPRVFKNLPTVPQPAAGSFAIAAARSQPIHRAIAAIIMTDSEITQIIPGSMDRPD